MWIWSGRVPRASTSTWLHTFSGSPGPDPARART
jgi:hypothetical protein